MTFSDIGRLPAVKAIFHQEMRAHWIPNPKKTGQSKQTQPLRSQLKLYSTGSHWVHQSLCWVRKALRWHFRYQHVGIGGNTPNAKHQCDRFSVAAEYRLKGLVTNYGEEGGLQNGSGGGGCM